MTDPKTDIEQQSSPTEQKQDLKTFASSPAEKDVAQLKKYLAENKIDADPNMATFIPLGGGEDRESIYKLFQESQGALTSLNGEYQMKGIDYDSLPNPQVKVSDPIQIVKDDGLFPNFLVLIPKSGVDKEKYVKARELLINSVNDSLKVNSNFTIDLSMVDNKIEHL